MWNISFLLPVPHRGQTHMHVCTQIHIHSFPQTPWVKHFRIPPAKPLWDSRMTTTGDSTSDSVSSVEPFDQQQSFQNGMKVLGNWELVLWAIRYLADGKINPHPLLVIKKEIYFPPTKKVKGLDRYQLPWQLRSTTCSVHPVTTDDWRK